MTVTLSPRQEAFYNAQHGSIGRLGIRWTKISDINAYLSRLVNSEWFFENWPWFEEAVAEKRGAGSVFSTQAPTAWDPDAGRVAKGVLLLVPTALDQPTVLHELAHLLAPADSGHDFVYEGILLELIRHEMGFMAYADFYNALRRIR